VLWVRDDAVEVATIGVAAPYQGRGVGSALLEKAEATARRLGKRYVYLDVRLNNTRGPGRAGRGDSALYPVPSAPHPYPCSAR